MGLYTQDHDAPKIVEVAHRWVDRSLIGDGSVFGDEPISTAEHFDALDRFFVRRPDAGDGTFYEKLETQLADAPPGARKLMAELLWALLLFPSNIGEDVKREGVVKVWGWSGDTLDPGHPLLADGVLGGIGSGGMGVNTNRWRELNYLIGLGQVIKPLPVDERRHVLGDYDSFMAWIAGVPSHGNRQYRHMLRYFLFPERVERMSSNNDRMRVLQGFGIAPQKATAKWSDRQLDDALFKLRKELEATHGTADLDFYLEPLRARWILPNDDAPGDEEVAADASDAHAVNETVTAYPLGATSPNLILYGPPGTGKTRSMRELFKRYVDQPVDIDRAEWEVQTVARFGWRSVVAVALHELGRPAKAKEILEHALVRAKVRHRQREHALKETLWGVMQIHSAVDSATVNVSTRRPPFIFDKVADASWRLLDTWRDEDPESAELATSWRKGPGAVAEPVQRYRVVTFHPSYSYEDFVVGLRPVTSESGMAGFRMVDGVFKQICAQARAHPARRHALFIDEINRANIAKVFGELITLIEIDKRAAYDTEGRLVRGMEVQLPGTGGEDGDEERFGVPENLDIIGTMNTADRSIALLDIALRRRFEFEEMAPDYSVIRRTVDGIDLGRLLMRINDRIEFLAGHERLVGHGYFTRVGSLEDLRTAFSRQIIPLLQEYFHDDFARVEQVLGDAQGKSPMIERQVLRADRLFATGRPDMEPERPRYRLTPSASWDADAFRSIYEDGRADGVAGGTAA